MSAILEAGLHELDPATLYEILRLRVDVFVVEQECPYPELDGFDIGAAHLWIPGPESMPIAAYLRVIDEGRRRRIGRVVTHPDARSDGLAGRLLEHVLATTTGPWFLSAQSRLRHWYEGFGFVEVGAEYLEDGIPHVDMLRGIPAG